MNKGFVFSLIATLIGLIMTMTSCDVKALIEPTTTPLPSATPKPIVTINPSITPEPTITPTPAPQEMDISEVLEKCADLDARDIPVILTGKVFLPEETIYGYEGWYGMDLISTSRVRALFSVGSGANQMEDLPRYFFEQDLIIHASDGRLIRHGHEVRINGRVKYRADNENRRCEVYVDSVKTLMPTSVLEPVDVTVRELVNDDEVNDCDILEFSRQFVRLTGYVRLDDSTSLCQLGNCKITFTDNTGKAFAYLLEGERPNHMKSLPEQFSDTDLVLYDQDGAIVENQWLSLTGVTQQGDSGDCELIVYTIANGK